MHCRNAVFFIAERRANEKDIKNIYDNGTEF